MKEKPFTPSELLQRIKDQLSVPQDPEYSPEWSADRERYFPSIEEQNAYWIEKERKELEYDRNKATR